MLRAPHPFVVVAAVLAVFGVALLVLWSRSHGTVDSRDPSFTQAERIAWITKRIEGDPPTPILDAHFQTRVVHHEGSHMGPGWSMGTFNARIEVPPSGGAAWAARSRGLDRVAGVSVFGTRPTVPWGYSPDEEVGLQWVEAEPIFGEEGVVAITADGSALLVYIVRR